MKNKILLITLTLFFLGCKQVQSNKQVSNNSPSPSLLQQVVNYITNVEAIDYSTGTSDAGKIVKLNSNGLIDPSMLPPPTPPLNLYYYKTCAFPPISSLNDILFTRVNKTDVAQILGQGLKITRVVSSNSAGSFFGGGVGNKAFLGVASAHGSNVSSFTSFKVTLKHLDGDFVYVNLLVDLDGDFSTAEDRITVTMDAFGSKFNFSSMTTYEMKPSDSIWLLSSYGTVPPASTGLNPMFVGPAKTLDDLKSLNPNAKFYTGVFFDGGYPKACPTAAINLTFGDSSSTIHQTTLVESLEFNGVYYDFK